MPNEYLTITLTGRPPVKIKRDDWTKTASAEDTRHDGEIREQANTTTGCYLNVREHDDGRAIVYGIYVHGSNWVDQRDYNIRAGKLLASDCTAQDLIDAIKDVGEEMATKLDREGLEDTRIFRRLPEECIANMAPEELV